MGLKKYLIQMNYFKQLNNQSHRFLCAGIFNTAFGYVAGVVIYLQLRDVMGIFAIGIIMNIITITASFLTYKLFVFRSKGKWIHEYIKAYLVYGVMGLVSIALLEIFVNSMGINIYWSQFLILSIVSIISYISHNKFTFKRSTNEKN